MMGTSIFFAVLTVLAIMSLIVFILWWINLARIVARADEQDRLNEQYRQRRMAEQQDMRDPEMIAAIDAERHPPESE